MKRQIRVGTRESNLAVAQTQIVVDRIKEKHPELEFELIKMKTQGDMLLDKSIDKLVVKGLFVNELEKALLEEKIDFAVHSMKDMPTILAEGLYIASVSKREDPRDVLVTNEGLKLDQLKSGAVVGTSSIRRNVQILEQRPDLQIRPVRGNINTRLDKLSRNEYDALVLAAAGLKRLDLLEKCSEYFDEKSFIPAIGQGVLCIEARVGANVEYLMDSVHDEEAAIALEAERAFMKKLNGGCSTPVACYAEIAGTDINIYGMYVKNEQVLRKQISGNMKEAHILGEKLAELFLEL